MVFDKNSRHKGFIDLDEVQKYFHETNVVKRVMGEVHGCTSVAEGTTAWMQELEQRMEQLPRKPRATIEL